MALTATEEAQVKALIAQNAALLSLASSEPTIISKLAATKVSLADLTAASTVADSDLFLVRQGSTEKSITKSVLAPIATNAEAQAFTSGKLIDGAKLATALQGANQSLATSGYQKLPGGLIIQWGNSTLSNGAVSVSYPLAFTNSIVNIQTTNSNALGIAPGTVVTIGSGPTLTAFNAYGPSGTNTNFFWFALGY